MTRNDARYRTLVLLTAVLLVPGVWIASPALASEDLRTYSFHPGAPGEPAWTMLKLEVPPGGSQPRAFVDFERARCPLAWEFLFLVGSPEDAIPTMGMTFDWPTGEGGYIVETGDALPLVVNESDTSHEGADWCFSTDFDLTFGRLAPGTTYLLSYTAGMPIDATATFQFHPPVQIVDASHGASTFYVNATDFHGGTHASVRSPPAFQDTCDPSCAWTGSEFGLLDVGKERSATLAFENHPFFTFTSAAASMGTGASISGASITDPLGRITSNGGIAPPVAGYAVYGNGMAVARTRDIVPGPYEFNLNMNAEASARSSPAWHIFGVDLEFPEEQP